MLRLIWNEPTLRRQMMGFTRVRVLRNLTFHYCTISARGPPNSLGEEYGWECDIECAQFDKAPESSLSSLLGGEWKWSPPETEADDPSEEWYVRIGEGKPVWDVKEVSGG